MERIRMCYKERAPLICAYHETRTQCGFLYKLPRFRFLLSFYYKDSVVAVLSNRDRASFYQTLECVCFISLRLALKLQLRLQETQQICKNFIIALNFPLASFTVSWLRWKYVVEWQTYRSTIYGLHILSWSDNNNKLNKYNHWIARTTFLSLCNNWTEG